ncbi:uncharacterized protein B0H18DRAFT_991337 [Fomitopsis serialis]|uniref:uncharacterized protein n=1 Tax=Fomitopsis serialis TaxID=139415 RepID=UPI0020080850|nr:uncharacterized protein B0H18DRAFT_991337 [Neoantrodia serialis]KAH9931350.1 hypothetical protein B0H18DRAFT_991337 [Neoantrodia serialis]
MAKETFRDVRYYISLTLRAEQREQLADVLNAAGATAVTADDPSLTHFVANSLPNDDTLESLPEDTTARLVTPTWVERSRILDAPQSPDFYSPDPAQIFSGVTATATDLSASDAELMCASITALGGQWRGALTRDVTHVFALAPGSQKYETALHFKEQTGMLVLVPHWHDDSIRLGIRGLPTAEYEWPEPAVFRGDWSTSKDGAASGEVPPPYRISGEKKPFFDTALAAGNDLPRTRAPAHNVWNGLRMLLAVSLGLSDSQRSAHEEDIRREGGVVVELDTTKKGRELVEDEVAKVDEADVFVTAYRSGPAFVKAYKENKTIGTLPWVWYCRATGSISHPTDQLVHYPIPRRPIEGFSKHFITITNYTGKHRDYLKKLILTMGAEFTPSMSPKNTVVVAAYMSGTKAEKAVSWSIPVVNHTWLEDCFVQWRNLTPALERYINFPPRTDFSKLITERPMGGKVILEPAELETLEKEGLDGERGDGKKQKVAGKENKPPLRTAASAREMKEVEDAVAMAEDPAEVSIGEFLETDIRIEEKNARRTRKGADDEMDADEGESGKPKSKGSSPRKYQSMAKAMRRRGAARPDEDAEDDGPRPSTSASPDQRRTRSARAALVSDQDSDVEMVDQSPLARKAQKSSSRLTAKIAEVSPTRTKRTSAKKAAPLVSSEDEAAMEVDSPVEPTSARATRSKDKGVAQPAKIGPPKGGRKRTKPADDSESEPEPQGGPSFRVPKSTAQSSRSAVSESIEPDSPKKSTRSPRKEVTVVVPTVVALYGTRSEAGPSSSSKRPLSKMQSVRATATESPASPGKRGKPAREKAREETPESSPSPPPMPKSRRKAAAATASTTPETEPAKMETPSTLQRTPSRRAAASKATQKLRDEIMPDVVNFQKQLKSGAVRNAWESDVSSAKAKEKEKERAAEEGGEKSRGKKRASIGDAEAEAASAEEDEKPEKKRQRTSLTKEGKAAGKTKTQRRQSGKSAREAEDEDQASDAEPRAKPTSKGKDSSNSSSRLQSIRIMTTQITVSDEVTKFLKKLGVQMTTKPSECTHLVARNLVRTEKFLCAMAHAPHILNEKWLLASYSVKELLPEDKFLLKDPANEDKFGFKLTDALARAKANGGKLFKGLTFYVTPHVPVDSKLLKNVVTACGGQLLTQTPTVRILAGHPERHVVSAPGDRAIWRPLAQAGHRVWNQELILTSALKQEIDWENETYLIATDA